MRARCPAARHTRTGSPRSARTWTPASPERGRQLIVYMDRPGPVLLGEDADQRVMSGHLLTGQFGSVPDSDSGTGVSLSLCTPGGLLSSAVGSPYPQPLRKSKQNQSVLFYSIIILRNNEGLQ
ncbi:hypothetical protein XENORESO_004806 [Xenotaenia resolanae]|uniref:Uncharacterized protein n=1 Tax=Xenotaenia resolanae TaxID=208358 RepID=A0ABV0WV36_9TELE